MTAIGAMPEGVDEAEVAWRVGHVDDDELAGYAADVRAWVTGPYTGATTLGELRVRAATLLDVFAARTLGGRQGATVAGPPKGEAAGFVPASLPAGAEPAEPAEPAGDGSRPVTLSPDGEPAEPADGASS